MKVLLIGATGQIGYALTQALSHTSHPTTVLARNRRKLIFPANVRILEAPSFSLETFREALGDADCVIYGVGTPEQFTFDAQLFQRVNYDLFKTFLDALKESAIRRLIYISTYEVFEPLDGIIRESHPIADPSSMTPYYKSMTDAYQLLTERVSTMNLSLTTIHPAAVYGGLNTGDSFTNYIESLLNWRVWKTPVIINGRFPLVHADSLAAAVVRSLDQPGAYIVSDQMTSLVEIAHTLRKYARSYVPPTVPLRMIEAGTALLELVARLVRVKPTMAGVQVKFITQGFEPRSDHAQTALGWQPTTLDQGLQTYLKEREYLLEQTVR